MTTALNVDWRRNTTGVDVRGCQGARLGGVDDAVHLLDPVTAAVPIDVDTKLSNVLDFVGIVLLEGNVEQRLY